MPARASHPIDFDALPADGFVRAGQLVSPGPLPLSPATLWRWVKAGTFPAPMKLSPGVTAWRVGAVREWLQQQGGAHAPA